MYKRAQSRNQTTRSICATPLLSECPSGNSPLCRPVAFFFGWNPKKSERVPNAETMKDGKMQSSMAARLYSKRFSQYTY